MKRIRWKRAFFLQQEEIYEVAISSVCPRIQKKKEEKKKKKKKINMQNNNFTKLFQRKYM